jgi:hypothetical protein
MVQFNLKEFCKNNTTDIIILVTASFHKETDIGTYKYLMSFKSGKRLMTKEIRNAISPNHTMICGLKDATDRITGSGYNIVVISGINLGFKTAIEGKGLYSEELMQIFENVKAKGNAIYNIAITDGSDEIKKYIRNVEKELK